MTADELKELYITVHGKNDLTPQTFFENTPDEINMLVPGWSFEIENTDDFWRGICRNDYGDEIIAQEETLSDLPYTMERKTIIHSLRNRDKGKYILSYILCHLAIMDESAEITTDGADYTVCRDNLTVAWKDETSELKVLQDNEEYYTLLYNDSDYVCNEMASLLYNICAPATASIGQDEVLDEISEHYPELYASLVRRIDLKNNNETSYDMFLPSKTQPERKLWVHLSRYSGSVGIYPHILCDDIGLKALSFAQYIDAILEEKVILITQYKNEEKYNERAYIQVEWDSKPESMEKLENGFAKKAQGLGKLVNKGKIVDVFSFNGTYDLTVKL